MENINSLGFFTKKQLGQLIDLNIDDVIGDMDIYCKFKGLLLSRDNSPFYANGFFIIEESKWGLSSSIDPITGEDSPPIDTCFITAITGTKYSDNNELLNNTYNLKTTFEKEELLYSYDEFKVALLKLGAPQTKDITELNKKSFNYDVGLINQKSNFTLEEASRIAANAPLKDQQSIFYSISLVQHYQEIIAECVKGQNQHGCHLITKELWVHSYSDYEPCSRKYDNGTPLVISANIDLELTIISKNEFLRWCKYMDIETGLYYQQKSIDESVEALKIKLSESEEEASRILGLYLNQPENTSSKESSYPPELQLAIDAYEQLCLNQEPLPTSKVIQDWLQNESKERGITHRDGAKELKGLSDTKLKRISSIIKSQ
ncbi:hypothetical protein [Colwellia sp. PAMC 21821]|uniref:hypothetical protein n=1 Tax=Colwellia sp. PAMC 21821 TaxID=1816219 RepID=UPI0009BCC7EC|nr:hypothetical protein [Colwellia sp. PAMC 21821]ARD45061.1 hypothetical protein A3Q33_12530 [Colwellia sp. PAMC 21821]